MLSDCAPASIAENETPSTVSVDDSGRTPGPPAFHSSDAEVWAALRTAVERAGLDLANATYLDKQKRHKGYKGRSGTEDVAAFDVVLNPHSRTDSAASRSLRAGKVPPAPCV